MNVSGGIWANLAALTTGILLGSVLPADLIARARGVDLASVGDGNPGTVNAFMGLGVAAGVVTLAYDATVGVISILIAQALGVSEGVAYAAGLMAVVGHRFPLYSRFRRGGQAMAASAGLLLYAIGVALIRGWLTPLDIAMFAVIAIATYVVTRTDTAISLVILPIVVGRLAFAGPDAAYLAFVCIDAGYIWAWQFILLRRRALRHEPRVAR